MRGSHLLLAVGRRPNTDDLGLDKAGVDTDAKGYIVVDDQCRTNVEGIWAIGDCNGRGAFTHTSYNDFEIVAANLFDNDPRRIGDRIAGYGLFIDPPLGRVGMTEHEVRAKGSKALTAKRLMEDVGRAYERGETQGFMKLTVDAANQSDSRSGDSRHRRRRGRARAPRRDGGRGSLHRHLANHAHSSHRRRVPADPARRAQAARAGAGGGVRPIALR